MRVTPETLTDEMIREWFAGTEKFFRHQIEMFDALGTEAGPAYRRPSRRDTAEARRRICNQINSNNARKAP